MSMWVVQSVCTSNRSKEQQVLGLHGGEYKRLLMKLYKNDFDKQIAFQQEKKRFVSFHQQVCGEKRCNKKVRFEIVSSSPTHQFNLRKIVRFTYHVFCGSLHADPRSGIFNYGDVYSIKVCTILMKHRLDKTRIYSRATMVVPVHYCTRYNVRRTVQH